MRKAFALALASVALLAVSSPVLASAGNVNFLLGVRSLNEDDWAPIDNQGAFGVNVDIGGKTWPVRIEFGFYGSGDEKDLSGQFNGVTFRGALFELQAGVMKDWTVAKNMHPFVGGGLALIGASVESEDANGLSVDDDDNAGGVYVHGGIFWRLGKHFNIGFDGRLMAGGDVTLFGVEGSTNYAQFGLVLGVGWN